MKTKLTVLCAWCGAFIREIDGQGNSGESHGICDKCFRKETRKIRRDTIKKVLVRLNPLNIFRRQRMNYTIDEKETLDQEQAWIADNPQLHAICLLRGERYVSYLLLPDDLQDIMELVKETPEMKARNN